MKSSDADGREKEQSRLGEEIQSIIDEGEQKGLIDETSGAMIQSILEFRDRVAREVMVPRTEIVAIPVDTLLEEILDRATHHGYTRLPVYEGNVDNIIGILNVKDLLRLWPRNVPVPEVSSLFRKPYFIPETKNIHELLQELRNERQHIAIVIDEYGGTSGLVTLEDVMEEIVGEIQDEHDDPEEIFTVLPDGGVLVDSRVEIEQIERRFGVVFPTGKYETLAGFILHTLRKIPLAGDRIRHETLELVIASADERSIKKVKILTVGEASPSNR
jgi:CBS domain containing-hemolysin-like protein